MVEDGLLEEVAEESADKGNPSAGSTGKMEAELPTDFQKFTDFSKPEGYELEEGYWISKPFTWAAILHNPEENKSLYQLVEPNLKDEEKAALVLLDEHLLNKMTYEESDVDPESIIEEKSMELLEEYNVPLESISVEKVVYYLKRNYLGYGKVNALFEDPRIEDISCDGVGKPIYLYHRDYQNIRTNIKFEEESNLDVFVNRLVEKGEKQISLGEPTIDATLPQGYRLQATLGREVTAQGSTFTVRKYREEPFTPVDLIQTGTFSPRMLAYLWLAAENKMSTLIVGGTASGKTSTLNSLSLFLSPDAKIVSIEDTRELTLYQENWIQSITRPGHGGRSVTMHDLVTQALRQRPEIIIVGEVRGKEALALFQAMTTGHSTYSTIHAGSVPETVQRLEGEPLNVPHHMLSALDIVCVQLLTHSGDRRVRRNEKITEIKGIDEATGALRTNRVFEWDSAEDRFEKKGQSTVLDRIREDRGWSAVRLNEEVKNRRKVLERLAERDIRGLDDLSDFFRKYYFEPEAAMEELGVSQ